MYEAGGETDRNESLADDNTTLLMMEEENLRKLRRVLDSFGSISGLKCNFNKTVVMPIGDTSLALDDYSEFTVRDSVKLLGMTINNDLDNVDDIFFDIGERILNLVLFWSRFRLTLTGRIAILKTLLIPQINYLGCFLTPSRKMIDSLQDMLDEFAMGNLPCARSRRYLPPEKGGLGLIHIGTFLMAQKCSWVKRAHDYTIDNWRLTLKTLSPNYDISLVRLFDVDKNRNPILFNIVEGYQTFVNCYSRIGNNFSKIPIFRNPIFVRSKADNNLLDQAFFGKKFYEQNSDRIRRLTLDDCFTGNSYKTVQEFADMNLPLTQALWMRLRAALLLAKNNFNECMPAIENPVPAKSISNFLVSVKRG
jgi:hypothetical protein